MIMSEPVSDSALTRDVGNRRTGVARQLNQSFTVS